MAKTEKWIQIGMADKYYFRCFNCSKDVQRGHMKIEQYHPHDDPYNVHKEVELQKLCNDCFRLAEEGKLPAIPKEIPKTRSKKGYRSGGKE